MKLTTARVTKFKSVDDSESFNIDPAVTALVGKNESGKTAVLHAMYRLNPLPSGHPIDFQELRDYPRRYRSRDQKAIPTTNPVQLKFAIEEADRLAFEAQYGEGTLTGTEIVVNKPYGTNLRTFANAFNLSAVLRNIVTQAGLDGTKFQAESVAGLVAALTADGDTRPLALAAELTAKDILQECWTLLAALLPKFQYFDEYNILPGRVSIARLQTIAEDQLPTGERTALALLKLAGVATAEFTEANYEARKAALEAAGNELTDQLFEYWTQNTDLSIVLDIEFERNTEDPTQRPEPFLQIRVHNQLHRVTLNMSERSKGFVWFFSFLAAFSEYADDTKRIILLDEPGLNLHAKAQNDLLRFIDDRLAPYHQVIYTTHSLFMIEPSKLERCRTVEDVGDEGTKVSSEIWAARPDTVFPLLGSLGIDMTQTLIIGSDQLLVEGPSEVVYLNVMSELTRERDMPTLDPRWTITPVGGIDKIPTFVALLNGGKMNITVIFDVSAGGNQRLDKFIERGLIESNRFIPLTEITGTAEADIEDLFDVSWYLKLLDKSKVKRIPANALSGDGRIIKQVEDHLGGKYDHFQPASYLLRRGEDLVASISDESISRFAQLFERLNALLS